MSWVSLSMKLPYNAFDKCNDIAVTRPLPFYQNQSHDVAQIELKLHHRMSWVSLSMKSPYNALRFV